MTITKITVLSAIAAMALGFGTASYAECVDGSCEDPETPVETRGNPGNAKPVGNSPWDGITGNSGNNNPGPRAGTMDGQRPDFDDDNPYDQPGGKTSPSNANK
ncbi:hypothetical protein SAMN05421665_0560 [Yoonia rosea]|uniref:Uncharacterized protein n=1 Tax=Yoonia rosea TaxID=287098 RepID=A0A1R3WGQ6_9RHOB|nr:hypothetical protein [Yoonia rosea]SIT77391.1 hypothetical protein SAMN05421665_0560 [Yoonia rosea]